MHCVMLSCFWKKLLLLACFIASKYAVFCMNTEVPIADASSSIKYLKDYRRPSSNCKSNEEWPHVALRCYNESKKELSYMKRLIVDRLTRSRFMSLWNV